MTVELNLDWLISVDDHILEPPNLWVDRVPAKDRDRAPHMERRRRRRGLLGLRRQAAARAPGLSAVAGKSKEEFSPEPVPYAEMRPGCYDPVGAARGHGPRRHARLAVLPDAARGSAASCSWRPATGSSASCACRPTTTG